MYISANYLFYNFLKIISISKLFLNLTVQRRLIQQFIWVFILLFVLFIVD